MEDQALVTDAINDHLFPGDPMKNDEAASIRYMNVRISNTGYLEIHKKISLAIRKKQPGYICLTDVGNVIKATKDKQLQESINGALFSVADGTPLTWFARMAGCKRIERVSGMDLMAGFLAQMDNCKHFLLGDTVETLSKVIEKARRIKPDISITGYSPPFKSFDDQDNRNIIEIIRRADPDIIWVSFGGGKQEKWMKQNIEKLEKGIMIGVGAAFRWFTGDIKAPPLIFQRLGMQWFFRMLQGIRKDPRSGIRFFIERQVKKFPVFLVNFPIELVRCRKRLRQIAPVSRGKRRS